MRFSHNTMYFHDWKIVECNAKPKHSHFLEKFVCVAGPTYPRVNKVYKGKLLYLHVVPFFISLNFKCNMTTFWKSGFLAWTNPVNPPMDCDLGLQTKILFYMQSNEIQEILIKYNAYFKKALFHSGEKSYTSQPWKYKLYFTGEIGCPLVSPLTSLSLLQNFKCL